MLLVIDKLSGIDLDGIYNIYGTHRDLYTYYMELFRERDAFCAVWITDNRYRASLRIQRFEDGVLLSGLETALDDRKKGYAFCLVIAVLNEVKRRGCLKVYSHIDRKNIPSQKLHLKAGFYKLRDTAHLLDGTVTSRMDTFCVDL